MMKRVIPLIVGALLLSGCVNNTSNTSITSQPFEPGSTNSTPSESTPPITAGDNTVLLVLGPCGLYNGEKGVDDPYMMVENAIEYCAPIGSTLPGADVVTSTSPNTTFETWISYEGTGTPTRFSELPSESYKILYAWYSFNYSGGGGGGGGGGGETDTFTENDYFIVGSGSFTSGGEWSPQTGIRLNVNDAPGDANINIEYYAQGVAFAVGDKWKITNGTMTSWLDNGYENEGAFKTSNMHQDASDSNNVYVDVAGTYDIYFKIYKDLGRSCYVGVSA